MKKKYRILEKRYSDGSVWYFPQMGDWWHGWRYICTRHMCPDIGPNTTKEVFKSYEDAEKYLEDLVSRLNNPNPKATFWAVKNGRLTQLKISKTNTIIWMK